MLSPACINTGAPLPRRCLVVDDDPTAIQVIVQCIARLPTLHVVGTCGTAHEALDFLQQQPVDILFLDVLMPLVSGLDLLRLLLPKLPRLPYTIMVTSSAGHAVAAFDYDVADYLLKPITYSRFVQAVDKVEALITKKARESCQPLVSSSDLFFIKGLGHKMTRVKLEEVHYFEAANSHVSIVTEHKTFTISSSLRELQKRLPAHLFAPIHRSFLVNIKFIEAIETDAVRIKKRELPISLAHRADLLKRLHIL